MFKKITSNRDPRDTVFSELGKEFRPYISKARSYFKRIADNYPKFLFGMMVVNMTLSVILVVTVFRPAQEKKKAVAPIVSVPVSGGFDKIIQTGTALRQTVHLKRLVDSLTKKDTLTKSDSALLLWSLDSLQHISQSFNSSDHEH